MNAQKLSDREELVLQAVVHSFITSAEPVGSRTVAKRFSLDISPATVRNVMADLEEAGFLQQLHTSSGRVPTDVGYRYYVDFLMRIQRVTLTERTQVEGELSSKLDDADSLLRQTSHLLALLSHQTGIVEAPSLGDAEIRQIEITALEGGRVVVLLADNFGRVRTMVVSIDTPLQHDDARKLTAFLNDNLRGVSVDRVVSAMHGKLESFADSQRRLAEQAVQVLNFIPVNSGGPLFLDGATQLFEQPEFRDVDRAREVFGLLEERDRVVDLLRSGTLGLEDGDSERSSVVIGKEASESGMSEISVVSAPYKVDGKTVGRVGVLGPRRMPYSRLSGVVEYTAGMLGRLMSRLAGNG